MKRRKLNKDEEKATMRGIETLTRRISQQNFYKKYYDLMLSEGLEKQFEEKRDEFNSKKRETEAEIEAAIKTIKVLKEHLKLGVPVKEVNKNVG